MKPQDMRPEELDPLDDDIRPASPPETADVNPRPSEIAREADEGPGAEIDEDEDGLPDGPAKYRVPS